MVNKIISAVTNQRGDGNIVSFIIVTPILLWFFIYIIFGGSFLLDMNKLTTIVNKSFDKALVEGQYTTGLLLDLKNELKSSGLKDEYLQIKITPSAAQDNNNSTYVKRGEIISISVIYKTPHPFYYLNFKAGGAEKYYIGVKIEGMSELW